MSKAAITAEHIKKYIKTDLNSMCIDIFDTVSSTNDICKQKAVDGAIEGYIAIASHQTAGRGQKGRRFHSPDSFCATAVDIDDRFGLVVKCENGELRTLIGGAISIKP